MKKKEREKKQKQIPSSTLYKGVIKKISIFCFIYMFFCK